MPHKGEETSDLVRTPQTRERAARVLCALSDNNATTLAAARSRCSCRVCVHKRKRGSFCVLLGKLRAGQEAHTQGRMVGASSPPSGRRLSSFFGTGGRRELQDIIEICQPFAGKSLFLHLSSLSCKVDVKGSPCVKPAAGEFLEVARNRCRRRYYAAYY